MNVACATSSMSGPLNRWFHDLSIIGDKSKVSSNLDLLILTGGSDINPSRYGEAPRGSLGWDDQRDEAEFGIVNVLLHMNSRTKILGICRGMQVLNILLGGSLIQDIDEVGKPHSGVHKLLFSCRHPLENLSSVNSLHHQAVRRIGDSLLPDLIAIEPMTQIPEILMWGNRFLGVQFHPEMFNGTLGDTFFNSIKSWVLGESDFSVPGGVGNLEEEEEEDDDHEYYEMEEGEVELEQEVDWTPPVNFRTLESRILSVVGTASTTDSAVYHWRTDDNE